ncbi:hypothetical protein SAMN04489743_0089 [Pseudarthrobacter equi]|uniref:Uncharacterized protein n=1 Tax=Pseudarthrobacter equi TaxID=728066 RepID=A0A1H1SB17_9MICC|nr:hypothetical protein SAMN04489743_0089 [Pseudarthrobacter equi]
MLSAITKAFRSLFPKVTKDTAAVVLDRISRVWQDGMDRVRYGTAGQTLKRSGHRGAMRTPEAFRPAAAAECGVAVLACFADNC